MVEILIKTWYN